MFGLFCFRDVFVLGLFCFRDVFVLSLFYGNDISVWSFVFFGGDISTCSFCYRVIIVYLLNVIVDKVLPSLCMFHCVWHVHVAKSCYVFN